MNSQVGRRSTVKPSACGQIKWEKKNSILTYIFNLLNYPVESIL